MARAVYLTLFFANAVVAALLREFGKNVLTSFSYTFGFFADCSKHDAGEYCIGNQIVYRMSFSMGCFFIVTGLLSCIVARGCENVCCLTLVQAPLYCAMLVCSLFIPNTFFDDYADVARVASALFMILQIIIILDYTYNVRDHLVDKIDEAERDDSARQRLLDTSDDASLSSSSSAANTKTMWEAAYLLAVVALLAASITGVVVMVTHFAGCDVNVTFIVLTLLSCVILSALSVTSWVGAGLLPAAAFTAYAVFLCYQAVRANPDATCTSNSSSSASELAMHSGHATKSVALNAALAAFTITWTSWRISTTQTHLFTLSPSSSVSASGASAEGGDAIEDNADISETALLEAGRTRPTTTTPPPDSAQGKVVVPEYQFHALMVLATFYMAMVITNWGSSNGLVSEGDERVTMWVKITSQWVATALFLWTLVAPAMFPDRDFGSP